MLLVVVDVIRYRCGGVKDFCQSIPVYSVILCLECNVIKRSVQFGIMCPKFLKKVNSCFIVSEKICLSSILKITLYSLRQNLVQYDTCCLFVVSVIYMIALTPNFVMKGRRSSVTCNYQHSSFALIALQYLLLLLLFNLFVISPRWMIKLIPFVVQPVDKPVPLLINPTKCLVCRHHTTCGDMILKVLEFKVQHQTYVHQRSLHNKIFE